jgi:hypothetical protein
MPSLDIDIDIDIDIDQWSLGGNRRMHSNSDLANALIDHAKDVVPSEKVDDDQKRTDYAEYYKYWDPELQAYVYLNEFLVKNSGWLDKFADEALKGRVLPQKMSKDVLNGHVLDVLNRVKDRANRAREILIQDTSVGAIGCWLNLLGVDPGKQPATNLLIHIGRRIGEHVVMCLKDRFKTPRPFQLCPAITPLIDAPAHSSFPAGHALQSYLISYLLAVPLKNLPQQEFSEAKPEEAKGLLFDLAARLAENRVVAGIHYTIDNEAGRDVAIACFKKLQELPLITELQAKVADELKQYA